MRALSVLFLAFFVYSYSAVSIAADFYWTHLNYTQRFASPSAVCHYYRSSVGECQYTACNKESSANNTHIVTKQTETLFKCEYYSQPSGFKYGSVIAIRNGDSCAMGSIYDGSKGVCVAPEQCTEDQVLDPATNKCRFLTSCELKLGDAGSYWAPAEGGGFEASVGGCMVATEDITECIIDINNKPTFCKHEGKFTGEEAGDGVGDNPENDEPEKSTNNNEECSSPTVDGEGRKTTSCTSVSEAVQEGKCDVGQVDGKTVCIGNPSPPSSGTKTQTDTTTTEQTNADGGTTTSKDSTTTTTQCRNGTCTTSTTNNNSTTVTNGAGQTTSEDSSCTGSGCEGPGPDEEEEDAAQPSVKPLNPPGDPGNFDAEAWDDKIAEAQEQLSSATDGLTDSFNTWTSLGISNSGAALPCTTTPAIMGRTYSFCFAQFQDELVVVGGSIVLICTLIAAFIVFSPR